MKTYKNRYGDEYWFERRGKDVLKIEGGLQYWRYGGKEGSEIDMDDLGFVDPSGGPFIAVGSKIDDGYIVKKIFVNEGGIFFEVTL